MVENPARLDLNEVFLLSKAGIWGPAVARCQPSLATSSRRTSPYPQTATPALTSSPATPPAPMAATNSALPAPSGTSWGGAAAALSTPGAGGPAPPRLRVLRGAAGQPESVRPESPLPARRAGDNHVARGAVPRCRALHLRRAGGNPIRKWPDWCLPTESSRVVGR